MMGLNRFTFNSILISLFLGALRFYFAFAADKLIAVNLANIADDDETAPMDVEAGDTVQLQAVNSGAVAAFLPATCLSLEAAEQNLFPILATDTTFANLQTQYRAGILGSVLSGWGWTNSADGDYTIDADTTTDKLTIPANTTLSGRYGCGVYGSAAVGGGGVPAGNGLKHTVAIFNFKPSCGSAVLYHTCSRSVESCKSMGCDESKLACPP